MAQTTRPARARTAPRLPRAVRYLAGVLATIGGLAGLTTGAFGPDAGYRPDPALITHTASLARHGTDIVITGSVDHIFRTAGFVGPNRADKRNRERITVDVASFSRAFEEQRLLVAALRLSPPEANDIVGPLLPSAETRLAREEAQPIVVASLDPEIDSAALSAIDALAPEILAPLPLMASQTLAYARANAPVSAPYETSAQLQASDKQLWCLATGIYFEARGEAYRGQVAVAQVILNRTKHRLYPKTVCGVVFQNQHRRNACQFSFACDGIADRVNDRKSWARAQEIARKVMSGELYLTEVNNATHYHATYVSPHWAPRMVKIAKVGQHIFYRFKRGWQFG